MADDLNELLEKSRSTDPGVLLTIKEQAKKAALEDPANPQKAAAFERASKMLEAAMQENANFKSYREVLAYAGECNRKVGQAKLYRDINSGRLKKQPDGSFKKRDVDRYFASLPMAGTTDAVAERAADRQRRKEEADIRKVETSIKRGEFDLAVKMGKFVAKEKVHLELAARAVTLASGLKSGLEARALDLIALVEGNPKKAAAFLGKLEELLDEAMNEYSRPMELTVEFEPEAAKEAE